MSSPNTKRDTGNNINTSRKPVANGYTAWGVTLLLQFCHYRVPVENRFSAWGYTYVGALIIPRARGKIVRTKESSPTSPIIK